MAVIPRIEVTAIRTPPVGIIKSIANTTSAARKNSIAIPRNVIDHSSNQKLLPV
jgi:hypothetical protein